MKTRLSMIVACLILLLLATPAVQADLSPVASPGWPANPSRPAVEAVPVAQADPVWSWEVEPVEISRHFSAMGTRSLVVGADGQPRLAYGENHLYYAWYDGAAWQIETVDRAPDVGTYTSLALDTAGRPRISYYDSARQDLKYAAFDGTDWHIETVDYAGEVGKYTSLALDATGWPHITYYDGTNQAIKYAYYDGHGWQISIVDGDQAGWGPNSLVLDAAGRPHVVYQACGRLCLRYAYNDGAAWQIEVIGTTDYEWIGDGPSLVLDVAGRPRVSYVGVAPLNPEAAGDGGSDGCAYHTTVWYAWNDGAGWETVAVGTGGCGGGNTTLALDSAGWPHIGYTDDEAYYRTAVHTWQDGTGWHTEQVAADRARFFSLAIGPAGQFYYGYLDDWWSGILTVARNSGAGWEPQVVDISTVGGRYTSLALDAAGRPHVSYAVHQDLIQPVWMLHYAWYDGTAWQVETLDTWTADYWLEHDTALALDAEGRPRIAYRAGNALKYAWYDGSAWQIEVLASGAQGEQGVGQESSAPTQYRYGAFTGLALDSSGLPHICYNDDWSTGDPLTLYYLYNNGSAWQTEVVDTAGTYWLGFYCSLALDSGALPRIAYGTDARLTYAQRDATNWYTQTLVPDNGGYNVSLALDGAGYPHISYCRTPGNDYPCEEADYIYWDGTAWSSEVVDSTGNDGFETSLALDGSGQPHLAYTAQGDDSYWNTLWARLMYASRGAGGWELQVVDDSAWSKDLDRSRAAYTDPSLSLDASGRPHIVYHASNDLLYARAVPCTPLESVAVTGPGQLSAGHAGYFTATYAPYTSTVVSLSWDNGAVGTPVAYSWPAVGVYSLTVTATNACSAVSATIGVEVACRPPEAVGITGPTLLVAGLEGEFQAAVQPLTTSLPLTWTWDSGATGPFAVYSWAVSGDYTVTVTATNECGQTSGSYTVQVLDEWPYRVYLPLVEKRAGGR